LHTAGSLVIGRASFSITKKVLSHVIGVAIVCCTQTFHSCARTGLSHSTTKTCVTFFARLSGALLVFWARNGHMKKNSIRFDISAIVHVIEAVACSF
jgi:hypothetical protein